MYTQYNIHLSLKYKGIMTSTEKRATKFCSNVKDTIG